MELKRKIDQFQEYAEKLFPYISLDSSEILKNEEKQLAMERLFLLMVDEAVDVNAALAYQLGGRIAESYKSSFHELVPLGLFALDFAEKIAESAKIRNQLTHDYEKLQRKESIAAIKRLYPLYQEYGKILVERFITPIKGTGFPPSRE